MDGLDVAALFKQEHVQVVQSVDAAGLGKLLKWLVDKVQAPPPLPPQPADDLDAGNGGVKEQIDALRRDNEDLRSMVHQLRGQQVSGGGSSL